MKVLKYLLDALPKGFALISCRVLFQQNFAFISLKIYVYDHSSYPHPPICIKYFKKSFDCLSILKQRSKTIKLNKDIKK